MFKTITLTEKELAIFINARCWEDIKYITPKGLDEYFVIYWDDEEYNKYMY